jgi:hypothetical protein
MRALKTILALTLLCANASLAQVTSGTLSGVATDNTGHVVTNAKITVTFGPTSQQVVTLTNEHGKFSIANLKPGSPYIIIVNAIGYRPRTIDNVVIDLGRTTSQTIVLDKAAVQLSQVKVVSDVAADAKKSGVSTQVSEKQILELPTLSRSLQDITRLNPQSNGVSFAGSNYRYNNLTIDGAASNDAFGFSQSSGQSTATVPTGTPGGLSRTQPISIDAIEQVAVSIAPYDVKIGNFTGGSINAVTKSGTNTTIGSVYSFGRTPVMVGTGASGKIPSEFTELQLGGRVGGALIKNKVFYFANVEISRRTDPILFAPGTNGTLLTKNIAQLIQDSLISYAARSGVAGYDAGTIDKYAISANNEKYFLRLDWNLGNSTLTIRNNFVNASAGNLERGQALNKLASQDFIHYSRTNSTVAELKSQLNYNLSNSLVAGVSVVSDHRTPYGSVFSPQIEIQDIQYGQINAGSDREATVYKQDTKTVELTDNLTWSKGLHTFTIGTHNEFYNVQYTFLNAYNGRWQYPNLTAFLKGQPNRIRATIGNPNEPGADFTVMNPSVYMQDELAVTNAFKLTLGIRADATLTDNATQSTTFSNLALTDGTHPYAKYTGNYTKALLISPRVGFGWDVTPTLTVRGGAGVFQGRMPFAWFAYPYIQNGIVASNVDYRPTFTNTFTSVPLLVQSGQQKTINTLYTQGNVYEINLIDNNYVQPQMVRGNLAFDIKLPAQTTLTVEGIYTKTLQDVLFTNQALPAPAGNLGGVDTRPIYTATRLAATGNPFSAVYLLSNTDKGYRYNITASVTKKFATMDVSTAYSYGEAKDVANGQRNSFQSNVEYNQLVKANEYPLVWSNFDIRHRIISTLTYRTKTNTTLSVVYSGASGSPYSYVYSGDLNGDGSSNNDLIYIPRTIADIKLVPSARPTGQVDTRTTDQIWADLDKFISSDVYLNSHRGQYAERNGARTPWNHRVDVRITQAIKNTELTFDISNVGNLLNSEWGKSYFVPNLNNQNVYPIQYRSGRVVGGTPSFSFDPIKSTYQFDDLLSRWQMQVGIRINF